MSGFDTPEQAQAYIRKPAHMCMYVVTFTDEWYPLQSFTTVLCGMHVDEYRNVPTTKSIHQLRENSPLWRECDQCLSDRAQYDSDKRAEERNEAILHFGRVDY